MGHRPPIAYTRKGEPLLNKEFTVDVLVIGWGKAGKTIAGRLAAEGRKVALVERSAQMYGGQLHQHRVRAYQGPHRLGIQAGRSRPRLLLHLSRRRPRHPHRHIEPHQPCHAGGQSAPPRRGSQLHWAAHCQGGRGRRSSSTPDLTQPTFRFPEPMARESMTPPRSSTSTPCRRSSSS